VKNYSEYYHDSLEYKEELINMFTLGQITLEDKAKGEAHSSRSVRKSPNSSSRPEDDSEDYDYVRKIMSKRYVGNFSLFQSIPDFWAIDQLFPIVPDTELNIEPDSVVA